MMKKFLTYTLLSALLFAGLCSIAHAQVNSNYLKYINNTLSPNVTNLKNVSLPATTTVATNGSSIVFGSINILGTEIPALFGIDSDGNYSLVSLGSFYAVENTSTNQEPTFGLASRDGSQIALISMATTSGEVSLNSNGTTTANQPIYAPCFTTDGTNCLKSYWVDTGTFLVNSSNLPVASTFPFYSLKDDFPGVFIASADGTANWLLTFSSSTDTALFANATGGYNFDAKINVNGLASTSSFYSANSIALGTTTPTGQFAIQSNGGTSFYLASSTAGVPPIMCVGSNGNVTIGGCNGARLLTLIQDFPSARTFLEMYNPNTTNGNGVVFSPRTDTTGTGATTEYELNAIRFENTRHDHQTALGTTRIYSRTGTTLNNTFNVQGYNVGVNVTSPDYPVSVSTTTEATSTTMVLTVFPTTAGNRPFATLRFQAPISTGGVFDAGRVVAGYASDGTGFSRSLICTQYPTASDVWANSICSDGSGRVGIGTTTPARPLVVYRSGERGGILLVDGAGTPVDSSTQGGTYLSSEAGKFGIAGNSSAGAGTSQFLTIDQTVSAGANAFGSSTPIANFQATTKTANATTSIQFGKPNQNRGTCTTYYDSAGTPVYMFFGIGATTPTYTATKPSGCQN